MDDLALIATFERITGASAIDVIRDPDGRRITFVVPSKHLRKAIGKNGAHVKRAADEFGCPIDVVEMADTIEQFVKNALAPARVENVEIITLKDGSRVATVTVANDDKGLAIGKDGRNVARAKVLCKRHFDVSNISIA